MPRVSNNNLKNKKQKTKWTSFLESMGNYGGGIAKDETVLKRFRGKTKFANYLYGRDNEIGETREESEVLNWLLVE